MSAILRLGRGYRNAQKRPEKLLPSDWGKRYYTISKGPNAGNSWDYAAGWDFQRGIVDQIYSELAPGEEIREAVLMKGAKAGCTLLCDVGSFFQVCHLRRSAAIVSPRKTDAQERSMLAERTINASSALKQAFYKDKGRAKKAAGGAELLYPSAETERDLVDFSAAVITCDERDRWVNDPAFNQDAMLEERQGDHIERVTAWLSTPTIPDTGVDKLYKASNRQQYHVKCPLMGCGSWQTLVWGDGDRNIVWDELAGSDDAKVESARFVCLKCGRRWSSIDRARANAAGEWVAEDRAVRRLGFSISRLYVPTALAREFVKKWLEAQHDVSIMREFKNQKVGEPFLADIGNLDVAGVQRVISSEVEWEKPPSGYTRLFAGVDVQGEQSPLDYVYEVRAYNERGDCALVCYGIVSGIDNLKRILEKTYGTLKVTRALIDISDGHHKPDVEEACQMIDCLEAARFDWRAQVSFQRVRKERQGTGTARNYSMSGWAVKEDDAMDDNMIRFFSTSGKSTSIVIARNPQAAQEKEFISHYTLVRRGREETKQGPIYTYRKVKAFGVDYPYAGALAEVARRIAGKPEGKAVYGSINKIIEAATAAARRPEPEETPAGEKVHLPIDNPRPAPRQGHIRVVNKSKRMF